MKIASGLVFLLIALLLLVVEWSFLPAIVQNAHILLFLPVSILFLSRGHLWHAAFFGAVGAYAHDYFSPLMFGVFLVAYLVTLGLSRILFQKWFPPASRLSVMTVGLLALIVFHVVAFAADIASAVLLRVNVHISFSSYQAFAQMFASVWTSLLIMSIIVALGGLLSDQIRRRLRIQP